jgi:hypothetical protein
MGWLALIAGGLALDGFVLRCLWNWHVATNLHAPTLNIFQAMGLVTVSVYFKTLPDEDQELVTTIYKALGPVCLAFISGGLIHVLFG